MCETFPSCAVSIIACALYSLYSSVSREILPLGDTPRRHCLVAPSLLGSPPDYNELEIRQLRKSRINTRYFQGQQFECASHFEYILLTSHVFTPLSQYYRQDGEKEAEASIPLRSASGSCNHKRQPICLSQIFRKRIYGGSTSCLILLLRKKHVYNVNVETRRRRNSTTLA